MDLGLGDRGYLLTRASRGLGVAAAPAPVVDQGPGGREPQPPARAGEQVPATAQPQVHQAAEPRRDRSTYCMIPPLR